MKKYHASISREMKKDIQIDPVENVYVAVVLEYNTIYKTNDWVAYLSNEKNVDLEMVLITSKGFDSERQTSEMRHKIAVLPALSIARIELLQEEVLELDNSFKVTFFENNKLYEKNFLLKKNTAKEANLRMIPSLQKKGILLK
jgi:hypothetical protein